MLTKFSQIKRKKKCTIPVDMTRNLINISLKKEPNNLQVNIRELVIPMIIDGYSRNSTPFLLNDKALQKSKKNKKGTISN